MRTSEDIKVDHTFWSNLDTLLETLNVSEDVVAEEMGFHSSRFEFHKSNRLSIPFRNVQSFSQKLGITTEALLQDQLSSEQIQKAVKINFSGRIPQAYTVGLGSKSFTVRHILKLAKQHNLLQEVCAHFNIHRLSFESKIDFPVSVQLASDVLDFISRKRNLSAQELSELGYFNSVYLKDTQFGSFLGQSNDVIELYERLIYVVNHLEQNWSYEIQYADSKKVVINSYPTEKLSDEYQRRDYSSYTFTKFRANVGAHLTRYIGLEGAEATVTKSIHHRDTHCQFNINVEKVKPLLA